MKNLSKIKSFYKMEYKKFIKNPKLVLSTFLVPIMMMIFIVYGITYIEDIESNYSIAVYCKDDSKKEIIETCLSNPDYAYVTFHNEEVNYDTILSGEEDVIIEITENIEIVYDSSILTNTEPLYNADKLAQELNQEIFNKEYIVEYRESFPIIENIDVSSQEEKIRNSFTPILVLICIIAVMLANMNIITLATDAISGEKERGTFDSLRLSGVSNGVFVIGKFTFICIVALLTYLLEFTIAVLTIGLFDPQLSELLQNNINGMQWILPIGVGIVEISILSTAIYILLSSFFDKVKHATTYSSIGMVIISLSVALPVIIDKPFILYIPVINLLEIILTAINKNVNNTALGCSGIISGFLCFVMLWMSKKILERKY